MNHFSRSASLLALCLALGACSTVERIMPNFAGSKDDATSADQSGTDAEKATDGAEGDAQKEDATGGAAQKSDSQTADAADDGNADSTSQAADATSGSSNSALNISQPAPPEEAPNSAARLGRSGWQSRVSPDIPYFNLGTRKVVTYADSDLSERSGALARGEGGFVETCRDDAAVCRVATGNGGSVWVEITKLSGVAN